MLIVDIVSGSGCLDLLHTTDADVSHWFLDNGLMLNTNQTAATLFVCPQQLTKNVLTTAPNLLFNKAAIDLQKMF